MGNRCSSPSNKVAPDLKAGIKIIAVKNVSNSRKLKNKNSNQKTISSKQQQIYHPEIIQIELNLQPLMVKIESIFLSKYKEYEKEEIYQLLRIWKQKDIAEFQWQRAKRVQSRKYYKQIDMLSARIYGKAIQYINDIKSKSYPGKSSLKVQQFQIQNDLVLSYDRYFWHKKTSQRKNHHFEKTQQIIKGTVDYLKDAIQLFQKQIPLLDQIFRLMIELQIIANPFQPKQITNSFTLKMQRISREEQKKIYLESMKFPSLQIINNWDKDTKQQVKQNIIRSAFPNYHFYTTQQKNGVKRLHKRYKDYQFLEQRHDYIQLMFPNHYGSDFNSQAKALNYIEKQLFFVDQEAGKNVLASIVVFFDFMGIKMDLKNFQLECCSSERLKSVLIHKTHNHLRIMRVLACLSVIGYRRIALSLIQFLDQISENMFPSIRNKFKTSWQIYGNKDNTPLEKAKKMCFLENEEFPKDHLILTQNLQQIQILSQYKQSNEKVVQYNGNK